MVKIIKIDSKFLFLCFFLGNCEFKFYLINNFMFITVIQQSFCTFSYFLPTEEKITVTSRPISNSIIDVEE